MSVAPSQRRRRRVVSLVSFGYFWLNLQIVRAESGCCSGFDHTVVIPHAVTLRGGDSQFNDIEELGLERAKYVRRVLNERLQSVISGKRGRDFSHWVRKTGDAKVISMHGTEIDSQVLELKHSLSREQESRSPSLFPQDKRDLTLVHVNNLPDMYSGMPQHLLDTRPPSFLRLVVRAVKLTIKFAPVTSTCWLAYLSRRFREKFWFAWVAGCMASSGPAFIKWGQWASTREDMFPEAFCDQLAILHNEAPSHSWSFTQMMMESSLGLPHGSIMSVFQSFDRTPLASGSIAQVHKAVLRADGDETDGTVVAVKVRHPFVSQLIDMDFRIMSAMAWLADSIPALSWLHVRESVEQFSHTMAAQAHLNVEAHHLEVLNYNFRAWDSVQFPRPFYASSSVIIETFEAGSIISRILDNYDAIAQGLSRDGTVTVEEVHEADPPEQPEGLTNQVIPIDLARFIVTTGLSLYLKMLLVDNLMHADLHPGNILLDLHHAHKDSWSKEILPVEGKFRVKQQLGITLVDAGMVAQLTEQESANFIGLLCALGEGDGEFAAECALRFSSETVLTPEERKAFAEDMLVVFRERCSGYHTNVDVGYAVRGILGCIRKHHVRVDANYATLVVNVLCIDGLAKRICPSYNVLDAAKPLLQSYRKMAYTQDGVPRKVSQAKIRKWMPLMYFVKEIRDNAFFSQQKRLMKQRVKTIK